MSTFPEPKVSELPGGFAAARLTVVSDDRVRAAEEQARGVGYSAGYAAGIRAAATETDALRKQLAQQAEEQQRLVAQASARSVASFATAIHAADDRVLPLFDESRSLLYSLALDLASAVLAVDVHSPSQEIPGLTLGAHAALVRALELPHELVITEIRLNPQDAVLVQEHWDAVVEALGDRMAYVSVVSDASLAPGDAISQFEDGILDARILAAMNRARVALDAELAAIELSRSSSPYSHDASAASRLVR